MILNIFLLFILIYQIEHQAAESQFCSTLISTTKQDTCPDPLTFDIRQEYQKPSSDWKLNLPIFFNDSDTIMIDEMTERYHQGRYCPYIRKTNQTVCCDGWFGVACDLPIVSHSTLNQDVHPSCHLWGDDHLRTFDGTFYRFPGSCIYKLVGSTTWQINIDYRNCSNCEKSLTITINGKTFEIIGTEIQNTTNYPSGLIIRRQDRNRLDLSFLNGLRVKIDRYQGSIIVQFDPNLINDENLSGLCADYNHQSNDDLKLFLNGQITSVPVEFGNQWKLDRNCPDVSPVLHRCSIVPEALSTAIDACRPLTNQSSLFASCSKKVNMEYFYDACLNDICSAIAHDQSFAQIRCQTIEAFVEECQEREIYPIQWRSETSCSKICTSANMSYVDCVSPCPATCQNPYPSVTSCHIQTSECIPGCVCADGTVYDSVQDRCVSLEECFCQHNQIHYSAGEHISIDCNDCRCDHGRWSCTNRTCSRTCLVLGQMNIWTFDGKQFALITPCKQILVEVNDQSNGLRIIYSNENNELSVDILRTKVTFRQNDVLINGNIRHTLPYQIDDVIIRRASTVFFEVRDIRSSVVIHFDPLTSRLEVKLDASFVNRVRGLCGTFNYVTNDDFLTPNNLIETNLVTFANAYLASSCSIPDRQTDACFNFPANEQQARFECLNLLKHPLFATCSSLLVDVSFFLNACTRDLCADQSTHHRDQVKCSMITALSHLCASKGIVIDWMSNKTLAQSCQTINYGQCGSTSEAKYSECLSECHSSCTDLDLMPSSCIEQCLPGCQCRSNHFYDEHSRLCRPREECPCYEQNSEQYIHPSHSLFIQTPIQANCSCSNGSLRCTTNTDQQCGSTQIYALNTTLCPRTCANHLSHYDCQLYGPGCTCPPGQILLDSAATQQTCVRIDQCPCQYNRQFYLENETIIQQSHGCQNCTCQKGGIWSCQKIICKKTCTSFGHSHYQTFDGLYYNFDGQCQYILAKDVKNRFQILSENVPCGMSGRVCAKNILLQYDGVTIDLVRDRPILVNNIELANYQSQPVTFGSIHIYQTGIYTNIKTDDILLRWDGQTYVEIEVTSDQSMAGLCGNNNDNIEDDLNSADGAAELNVSDMAKSWQTSAQCTTNSSESINADPCADRPEYEQRRIWARNQCDLIKIKSSISNNPFELCIDRMDSNLIEKYYQACLYDACHADRGGDCESVCTVISAYASHCQSIVGTSIIKWRTADRCPMQCDSGKVYMSCGPRCPQTCFEDEDYGGCIANSGCVDGCFCPNGQVMDNQGQCVQPRQCPCEHDNRIYPQSSRIIVRDPLTQCQRECECRHGSFICEEPKNTTCTRTNCTNQEFLCPSSGECIPLTWKCDQVVDCLDGTDESKDQCQHRCTNQTNIFQCSNGQCIDSLYRCDGLPDCRDGTDEINCTYVVPCREYECPISKLCIPKSWLCDGTVDCGRNDPSDESGDCKLNQCDLTSGRYFQCRDNLNCLPIESRCDAHQDCNDGSDETNCSSCTCTSSFTCLHTCQCLDSRRVCDGIPDCIDGTDESNCTISCQSGEYTCLDGKCLNRTNVCDGIRHCSKGEDETHPDCFVTTTPMTTSHPVIEQTLPVEELARVTTPTPNVSEPLCQSEQILFNDIYMKKPEISVPILGSFASFNPDGNGVTFKPSTSSTPISILLKFQPNIIIEQLVRLEIPRPSNVNRFQVTFLDRYRRSIGHYGMVSTQSENLFVSPLINRFILTKQQMKKVRALKIVILDTDDDRAPKRVTIRLEGCVKKKKVAPKKACVQIDAMNPRYTTKIIRKLGGTRPFNSTFGHLLRNYGGVTYNTSQAVIDVRFRTEILSNVKEISIPDFHLRRTNVKKIIVELFDRFHHRLFRKKTEQMSVKLQMKRRLPIRFLRVSIIETTDNFAPFNVTLSIKGCFYRKHHRLTKPKPTATPTTKITATTPSPCHHVNVFDRTFAHRIIGQIEGTKPLSKSSFLDLIESETNGTNYAIENPTLIVRFQSNVVGQLNEFTILGHRHNVDEFRLEFFDFHHQLLFSHQSVDSHSILNIPTNSMFVSSFQLTILKTIDHRPARGIRLSLIGCFSTIPTVSTTTTPQPSPTSRTEISPPRKCRRIQLMNDSRIIQGLVTSSRLIDGELGEVYHHDVTFADRNTTIDLVFLPNLLVHLSDFSIDSNRTNVKRFRLELLNKENFVQHTIESSSLRIHLDSLPSVIIGGIRLTFLETNDRQGPKNLRLSIIGCVETVFVPSSITTTTTTPRPTTRVTSITPDLCADVDAMEEPYSSKTLAGLAGTNPRGTNASLLDLLDGKSVSFHRTEEKIVLFVIFKSNLFVYLKNVGVIANVKRFQLDYLDDNQLIIRTFHIDYSTNKTILTPMKGIRAIRLTFEDEFVENLRLTVRGCFGIRTVSTTIAPAISTTTSPTTQCHSFDLMSNESIAEKIVAFVAGTNPSNGSIFDYFNTSKLVSFNTIRPTFILVFKRNIYAAFKSIVVAENQTNLRRYRIDLINNDRTILKTWIIDRDNATKQVEPYPVPIYALQITFLETIDDQPVKNIRLVIDGCFGIDRSPPPNSIVDTTPTPTPKPVEFTTPRCNEIELMNRIDSAILIDSISGTSPSTKLTEYFNETSLISYETNAMPIKFHLIFKRTIIAEIHSVSLIDSSTNVKRFQVDLIDDYKSIIQTIFSNENLTANGFSEIAVAAIRIVYLVTNDGKPPKNIRLSIRGCFGHLPFPRRTTTTTTTTVRPTTAKPKQPVKRKCSMLDAMSDEHRSKILQATNNNQSVDLFSPRGLSFNSSKAVLDIAFKENLIGQIENVTVFGDTTNVKNFQMIFFGIDQHVLADIRLERNESMKMPIEHVNAIRFVFFETTDRRHPRGIRLSIFGCFFQLPSLKRTKTKLVEKKICREIDLFNRTYARRIFRRFNETSLPTQIINGTTFFIFEFRREVFIRNLRQISIRSKNSQIQRIRIELEDKHRQLLKRLDVSLFDENDSNSLYSPIYPIHVRYLKVSILKGTFTNDIQWSIIGCFDRMKKVKSLVKTLQYIWWTVSCVHSNILAIRHQRSLMPSITGSPLPIEGHFQNLLRTHRTISYESLEKPIVIDITFPPGIIGRLYEVGIRSSNVYRIRVDLIETPNGLLYTLTTPHDNRTTKRNPNPRLTGFPPVHASALRIFLLDTIDQQPARNVKIFTNGCFYKSSVRYTTLPGFTTTTRRPKTTEKTCTYSPWTRWRQCSVTCGTGVQIRARNQLTGSNCDEPLIDYRMCQLQPCTCILTKEFYIKATNQSVPKNNIIGYLKRTEEPVHIGDRLDTGTIIYTYNCSRIICLNVGLHLERAKTCQHRCVYRPWSRWSSCQGRCGDPNRSGRQYRQRIPLHILSGSHLCQTQREYRSCRTPPCFGPCRLSKWSPWSRCSKSCGLGFQRRTRFYLSVQPSCADHLEERRDCNPQCCPSTTKPTWSAWGPWSECSAECDGGERVRYRTCRKDSSSCRQSITCSGSNRQVEPCNTGSCRIIVGNPPLCSSGQVWNNCSNACGHTCNTLTCRSCNEPAECIPGCVCPSPLVMNTLGECVELNQCLCPSPDGKSSLVSGQRFTDTNKCEDCLCSNGCLDCSPSTKVCQTCPWSDWSPYGVCSSKCNGTQSRYRSRSCADLPPEIEYENRTCSTNETSYQKGCAQCSCNATTGEESCYLQCAITPEICSNLTNDPFISYEYISPIDGQCCGSCGRVNKSEICAVEELPMDFVSIDRCISTVPIVRQRCLGRCISGSICRCCSPSQITMETISMNCQGDERNSTMNIQREMFYARIEKCACEECR